jgi:uncharacterized membrane protein
MEAAMIATYGFYFEQPWWLACGLIAGPVAYLAWRSLRSIGVLRRVAAITLRIAVVLVLAATLARPSITETHDKLALLAVMDRSQSVPEGLQKAAHDYVTAALGRKPPGDVLAVVDIAERADITRLPSTASDIPIRTLTLIGDQSRLAAGVQMALAIAPPGTAVRIILISDGNETAGDLKAVARVAAANRIPIDVLSLRYKYDREVVFRRLVAPGRARSGQTVPLRFVLTSTSESSGKLMLTLNGKPVDLNLSSDSVAAPVHLKPGTNVHTISLPVGTRGVHEFDATFIPDSPADDKLAQNNRASAVTFVAGPGHILVVSADPREAQPLMTAMAGAKIDARGIGAGEFPMQLPGLLDVDAIVLVNTPNHLFTMAQQDMICRYVTDLGGGLVTIGGPESYGAGGWLGSPVAKIIPVDMDPPQKKQMPKGALALIMHACEMPQGNFWGKKVATEAVKVLSKHDLIGVLDYSWNAGADGGHWVYPLSPAGDKTACIAKINQMEMGDMPDFGPPVQAAYNALKAAKAGQKHIIIISDGDPQVPSPALINDIVKEKITITGVAVFPHDQSHVQSLQPMARSTGGRFYHVKSPDELPKIFIKEAQVVRRSLIIEDPFQPRIASGLSDILRGVTALPVLDGRVLTGPKGGLSEVVLATPDKEPVLATEQAGLGRVAAFTSSADSRWAGKWLAWGGFDRFWEQTVRWAAKSAQATDCEAFADIQGRDVTLTVEAVQPGGKFVQFANIAGQVIAPDMTTRPLELRQIGPGQYRANFQADQGGSFLVNLRYRRSGENQADQLVQSVVTVPFAPEFEDLTDNSALLAQVAEITGGRILNTDPKKADLFSRAGLVKPQSAQPLTIPLLLAWVVLFLADVAVRRIAIDFAAIARGLGIRTGELAGASVLAAAAITLGVLVCVGMLPVGLGLAWHIVITAGLLAVAAGWLFRGIIFSRAIPAVQDATLAALKARRQSVQQQLKAEGRQQQVARRFVAAKGAATELPEPDVAKMPPSHRPATPTEPKKPQPPAAGQETHVSRLLDAKRRAKGQGGDTKQ